MNSWEAAFLFAWLTTGASALSLTDRRFKREGLIDLGQLGLPVDGGPVVALGDANGDQFQDLFLLSADQRQVLLYLWDAESSTFVTSPSNPVVSATRGDFVITNVVAADVNYDGRLDLVLMGSEDPSSSRQKHTLLEVWYGIDGSSFAFGASAPASEPSQPIVFDAQGDMMVDLLGMPEGSTRLQIWRNAALEDVNQPFEISEAPLQSGPACIPSDPHSNTFVDLDGDCSADLFLTCAEPDGGLSYQIWTNAKADGFVFSRSGPLPRATKQISFADMDRDGTVDMVFSACVSDNECELHVAFNRQMPLCTSSSQVACRTPRTLCTADPDFSFSFDADSDAFMTIPVESLFPGQNLVYEQAASQFRGRSPLALQIGDFNLDGYPDILLLTSPRTLFSTSRSSPRLLESRPCDVGSCTSAEVAAGRRAFRPVTSKAEALEEINDARSVFFMDVADDGSLDIVVQRDGKGGRGSRSLTFVKNNYFSDAFFLKALMLNGACQSWCVGSADRPGFRPYGANYAGASYKFIVQGTTGARSALAVGQMPFSSYGMPATPYSYLGLGRTNNYVENLFVGSTRHQPQHYINIEGVLPNSQIVISPFQPAGALVPATWRRELYIHPGDWIPSVMATLTAAILVLALTVLVLHLNEKREDDLERRRKAHTINFDAL